jgi:DNA-binding LytR/AlgR family response regulator
MQFARMGKRIALELFLAALAGLALGLIRMRDAIAELTGVPGLQVHRSWWVAQHGVAKINRQSRSMTLTLTNGIDMPVAREQIPRIHEAGWKA